MADMLNVKIPENKDGISYFPKLLGKKSDEHDYIICSSYMDPSLVTDEGWKLRYYAPKEVTQLYYLPNDYREENNLASENTKLVKTLKEIMYQECNGNLENGWFKNGKNILAPPD